MSFASPELYLRGFLFFRSGALAKKGKGYTLFSLGAAIFVAALSQVKGSN